MIEALLELLHREPFQPFDIATAGGDKYQITNPDLVAVGRDVIFIFTQGDRFAFVRNNQITAVESTRSAA